MLSTHSCQQLSAFIFVVFLQQTWSGRSGSNRRHLPWQGNALPTELRPHNKKSPGVFISRACNLTMRRVTASEYPLWLVLYYLVTILHLT